MLAVLAVVVAAALPQAGVLAPAKSLGGVRLGATPTQVRSSWGSVYGRCQNCLRPTWYFTYGSFQQQGAGVEFRRGRVAAVFTLWQPQGWRTTKGVKLGDPVAWVTSAYGALPRVNCGEYYALTLIRGRALTVFYVVGDKLWGFGLLRPRVRACR